MTEESNGHAPETPEAPPAWMHDWLPASCVLDCQGPDCPAQARAYWQPPTGWVAPGWVAFEGRPFCGYACLAQYAVGRAQAQLEDLQAAEDAPAVDLTPATRRPAGRA